MVFGVGLRLLTFLFFMVVNITFSQTIRTMVNMSLERKRLIRRLEESKEEEPCPSGHGAPSAGGDFFVETSLYIHIPFCRKKCFYCSFVVAIGQEHRVDSYLDCLKSEAEFYSGALLRTVYLGGGTPSFLNLKQLEKFLTALRKTFKLTDSCEWTIEINPEGLDREKAALLYDLGINRVSLGIQSLNDGYLKYLGRNHNAARAVEAFGCLRRAGFKNINLDLMYSFPTQTDSQIEEDISSLTDFESEHLSLYALTIEENSRFYAAQVKLSIDSDQARQYELVVGGIEAAGLKQYEVSNFAFPGKESLHNLNYWQGGDYIGLGVAAHSHLRGVRSWNVSKLNIYMETLRRGLSPTDGKEELTPRQRFHELVVFGLRMNRGVDIPSVSRRSKYLMDSDQQQKIQMLIAEGFLVMESGYLKTTSKGRLVLDEIAVQLV